MKNFLDKLIPWRRTIAALRLELDQAASRERALLASLELSKLQVEERTESYNVLLKDYEKSRRGTTLLREFIHKSHRLDVPVEAGSIREVMTNGNKL